MENAREPVTEDENAEAPAAGRGSIMLKLALRYAIIAFAPVLAVVALVVAVIAANRHIEAPPQAMNPEQLGELNASLAEAHAELENLKLVLARERSLREEEHKKLEERDALIVQHVSQLQIKLKISPTLEEQLHGPLPFVAASAPAAMPAPPPPAKPHIAEPAPSPRKPAAQHPKPDAHKPAAKDGSSKQRNMESLRDAIEDLNRKK